MSSVNTQNLEEHNLKSASERSKGKKKVLENVDYIYAYQSLQGGSHNNLHDQPLLSGAVNDECHHPMVASQQRPIQAPPFSTAAIPTMEACDGGGQRVVEQQTQRVNTAPHPVLTKRTRLPLSLFTDYISPRLRWTQKLHDRFVEAMMELGGPKKVKPKALRQAMAIDGLSKYHVKSHLQSFRNGKITVRDWRKPRRPRQLNFDGQYSASIFSAWATSSQQENGARKDWAAELYRQLQEVRAKYPDYQCNTGMGDSQNVEAGMFGRNLSGSENLETGAVTTPLNSARQQPNLDFYKALEDIRIFLGLEEESSNVSAGHQQPQVDVAGLSAANEGCFMTSNGYSFPEPYNNSTSTAINNVQVVDQTAVHSVQPGDEAHTVQPAQGGVGLQEQPPCFQNHNTVYNFQSGNGGQRVQPAHYCVGLQEQPPGSQNHKGVYNFQPGTEAHSVQPAEDGGALGNIQPPNEYFCLEPQAATYANASSSSCAASGLPMSNSGYSETADVEDYNAAIAAIMQNKVSEDDLVEAFLNSWEASERDLAGFDYNATSPFGFSGES